MRRFVLLLSALALNAWAEPISFGLFGDLPYSNWERAQLPKIIEEMDAEDLAFVVHDGDIKNGHSVCSDEVLRDIRAAFQASRHPLVYVPGDNEWTDCHRANNGGYDPLERLARLRKLFFVDDHALGQGRLRLERQSAGRAYPAYRENVRWMIGAPGRGALIVGLNVPGSDNNFDGPRRGSGPSAEFIERARANHAWLAQSFALARKRTLQGLVLVIQGNPEFEAANAGHPTRGYRDFLAALRAETLAFDGDVVLVHGDTHSFRIDQPMLDPKTREPVKNFTRVETFGSPFIGWVKGSYDAEKSKRFHFEARPYRPKP